jgi:hypothetical protein
VAGIIVQLPFLSRPVCLPVLSRLWRPRHTGKIAHAREVAELIAARYPDRTVHVVGDAAYVGEHLRTLGGAVALRKERAGLTPPAPGSDCECEFGEDRLEPAAGLDVVSEFVVAAA